MTSKEALEKLCKVKIYQKEASAYDYLGKEIYKEEIDTIKQDLERLEVLETSVLEYKDQEKLYWETAQNNVKLRQEIKKLKKIIKENFWVFNNDEVLFRFFELIPVMQNELKEVLSE